MKLICEKTELTKGIQAVQNVISSRTTLPILSHILMEVVENKLQLCATDLEVGVRSSVAAKVEEKGAITVPGHTIAEIVREASEEKIEIATEEKGRVSVKSGKSLFKIMGLPKEEFPKLPESSKDKGFSISKKALRELIKKTSFAISRDEARQNLNGILFQVKKGEVTAVATDGRRLAKLIEKIEDKKTSKEVILPAKAVNEVSRIIEDGDGEVSISIGENEVVFEMDEIMLVARLVKGQFPDYEKVIPKTYETRLNLGREEFLSAIKRVSILTSEKSNALRLSITKGKLLLAASTPELGEASEEIEVSYDGEEEVLAFNPGYLMDFLRNETSREIRFDIINGVSPAVLRPSESEDYLYVAMPIKV